MKLTRDQRRKKRHARVRKTVSGTAEKPRLVVFLSQKHAYAAFVVDDERPNRVIGSVSTLSPLFKERRAEPVKAWNVEGARILGEIAAEKARQLGVSAAVFDRGGNRYTGRVKALADAVRKGGVKL